MDYEIKEANLAQRIEINKVTFEKWGSGLTLETYLEREETLAAEKFSKDLKVWILIRRDDSNEDILSSLETYRRPVYTNFTGKFMEGDGYSIRAVFTPEKHRNKGFASKLINYLIPKLNSSMGISLYSSVGNFYERFGFVPYSSQEFHFNTSQTLKLNTTQIELLTKAQIKLLEEDGPFSIQKVTKVIDFSAIFVKPEYDCFHWHWTHQSFFMSNIKVSEPIYYGCHHNGSYLIWIINFNSSVLKIIKTVHLNDKIISKAISYAKLLGLQKVVMWGDSKDSIKNVEYETAIRNISIPHFRITDKDVGRVSWINNEAYGLI